MPRFTGSLSKETELTYKPYNGGKISDIVTQDI